MNIFTLTAVRSSGSLNLRKVLTEDNLIEFHKKPFKRAKLFLVVNTISVNFEKIGSSFSKFKFFLDAET